MNQKSFNTHAEQYDRWFDRNRFAYLSEVEALRKVVPKTGKNLEIGVGTGRFASPLDAYAGVDSSMSMLKIAQMRGVRAILGRGEDLPFKEREFDWVLMNTTLCFLADPQKTIEEAKRVMKNHGKFIVGIIDKESPLGRYYKHKEDSSYAQADFYSTEEVTELLHAHGFQDFVVYQTIFRPPGRMRRLDRVKDGFGEGSFVVISGGKG